MTHPPTHPPFSILYVKSPLESASFYSRLLGKAPVESAPTFVMFVLDSGAKLGLWATDGVEPAADAVGGSELAFAVDGNDAVDALHAAWQAQGLRVIQTPTALDFGYTCVALDADGHRLRAYAPADMPARKPTERP